MTFMNNPAPILERRAYNKGKQIVKEGEDAFTAFVVQSGKVRLDLSPVLVPVDERRDDQQQCDQTDKNGTGYKKSFL